MAFLSKVCDQVVILGNILKTAWQVITDPKMSSRLSLKTFLIDFVGWLLHEGLTNPGLTCEQVAEQSLGKGNFKALEGRVAIITGASSGLGLEQARVMMKYGCHVIFAVRSPAKAEGLLKEMREREQLGGQATILRVDLDDLTTVKPFVQEFLDLGLPLHYLINNAGVMTPVEFRASKQGFETQFATNHLAHFLMVELLLPKLREARESGVDVRIVILSSVASVLVKNINLEEFIPPAKEAYTGTAEYGVSKAMNLFHCRELQRRCQDSGILCCAVHPGVIETGLTQEKNPGSTLLYESILFRWMHKSIPQGAASQMYCTVSGEVPKEIQNGTCLWYNMGPQRAVGLTAPGVRDELCGKLYEASLAMVESFR
mmetsp:Transcript_98505/g.248707  ORF Transcript_98505/g.248707 Transcript_98505/m.248707 type:complete len:372 (-) Transcript_98505:416-1531(-)